VTVDTLRADHVGCYGAEDAHTPHLDALAREGVRFDVAVAPTPLTLPSHASLLTGLDPPAHGVFHNAVHRLPAGVPTVAERLAAAGYETAAFVGSLVLDRRFGLDRGFATYGDSMEGGRRSGTVGFVERRAGAVVDEALAWLAEAPPRFFLWVHFYDPHREYDPPPGFGAGRPSPYAGEIAYADYQLGRLLAAVEERFGRDGLLLVATSDHGESLGEHGEPTHSYTLYEATQRVPLLLRGAGLPAGRVVRSPVRLVDVAATLVARTGAAPLPDAEGRDLVPLVHEREEAPRVAYLETLAPWYDFGWSPLLGLHTGRWKYIRAPRPELYDLRSDPGETRNLYAARPVVASQLDAVVTARTRERRRPDPAVSVSPAERAGLEALGYLAPRAPAERAPVAVGGADPKDGLPLLAALAAAERAASQGRLEEAHRALAGLGDAPRVRSLRAAVALARGELAAAERDARAVVDEAPARADVWVILGRVHAARGEHAAAERAFRRALALDPRLPAAREGLADLGGAAGSPPARPRPGRPGRRPRGRPPTGPRRTRLPIRKEKSFRRRSARAGTPVDRFKESFSNQ